MISFCEECGELIPFGSDMCDECSDFHFNVITEDEEDLENNCE